MLRSSFKLILWVSLLFASPFIMAQEEENFSQFDYGRMWTFEDAPLDYFNKTYDLELDQAWMDKIRQSALRFSTFCSASFISPQGLIMTNHHCSRGLVAGLQKEGEDLQKRGFYAEKPEDERKSEGLFVDQLMMAVDITTEMKQLILNKNRDEAESEIKAQYEQKKEWQGLRLQLVTYYSGGRYALYGYKRYSDIRLVLIPEMDLGYFGGDQDNFTYPRYSLDFTFWRAYDDNGKPLNTSAFYYPVNPDGIHEGTPVFVVGNPGSTERYRTMTQLEYDRDVRVPATLAFLESAIVVLEEQMKTDPDPSTENRIFSLKNGEKVYQGILKGLYNEEYISRKQAVEDKIRSKTESQFSEAENPWIQLDHIYKDIKPYGAYATLLNASPLRGKITGFLHQLFRYMAMDPTDEGREELGNQIKEAAEAATEKDQIVYLEALLRDYQKFSSRQSGHMDAEKILSASLFRNAEKTNSWLHRTDFIQPGDPLASLTQTMISDFDKSMKLNQQYGKEIAGYGESIAHAAFQVFGDQLPPDATFTLRISDGVVKKYAYNGTEAPIYTTYFGLYDRFYSHQKKFPWDLPQKWLNPTLDLLKTPLNYISTNDVVGGNSGSAAINAKGEAVGLLFDGNIESLPGNFIFDDSVNRSVSVHMGGIVGALKHIYRADRILKEIL